ncbi:MAG: hypothetical protein ACI8P0_005421 [Planctomycetaceae bacterium]|jgi:hypothetical protein
MNVLTNFPSVSESSSKTLDEVLSTVQETDSPRVSWHQWGGLLNDRRAHRVAFPETLHVVGLTTDSDTGQFIPATEPIIAQGRDISVDGISFQHADPLPHRYVAVSFRSPFGSETVVARLSWCRFAGEDRYVSGGRLTVEPQLNEELNIDWDSLPTE